MEDSAINTSPKTHNDEQQKPWFWRKLGLGLGLNPFPSVNPDPNPNPPPPPAADQTSGEAIADQGLIGKDIDGQVKTLVLEERGVVVGSECVEREFDVDHELGTQETLKSEELQYREAVEEEIKNLVLEEKRNENDDEGIGCRDDGVQDFYYKMEMLELDYQQKVVSEENYKLDMLELEYQQEVEEEIRNLVLGEKRNECGEEGIEYYGNKNDYDYGGDDEGDNDGKSEIEKEDGGYGIVEGEIEGPMGWRREGRYRRSLYPVRPGAEDCLHYVRTGACKFGPNCKFNHPFRRKYQVSYQFTYLSCVWYAVMISIEMELSFLFPWPTMQ